MTGYLLYGGMAAATFVVAMRLNLGIFVSTVAAVLWPLVLGLIVAIPVLLTAIAISQFGGDN